MTSNNPGPEEAAIQNRTEDGEQSVGNSSRQNGAEKHREEQQDGKYLHMRARPQICDTGEEAACWKCKQDTRTHMRVGGGGGCSLCPEMKRNEKNWMQGGQNTVYQHITV